jgi:hypothetical protein
MSTTRRECFLSAIRSPFFRDILPVVRLPQVVPGWKVDMGVFDPSILIGDCPHRKGDYRHDLNVHFACIGEDVFMFHEGARSEEDDLYLFSFMGWKDSCSLLELVNMPKVPATHHFNCTTGIVSVIGSWRLTETVDDAFKDEWGGQGEAFIQEERDGELCWYCDREDCYDECSQL